MARLWTREGPRLFSLPLGRPLDPLPAGGRFGHRRVINGSPRSPHGGADYSVDAGTPVLAAADGTVAMVADQFFGGNAVFVDHGDGLVSMYMHMSRVDVAEGDRGAPRRAGGRRREHGPRDRPAPPLRRALARRARRPRAPPRASPRRSHHRVASPARSARPPEACLCPGAEPTMRLTMAAAPLRPDRLPARRRRAGLPGAPPRRAARRTAAAARPDAPRELPALPARVRARRLDGPRRHVRHRRGRGRRGAPSRTSARRTASAGGAAPGRSSSPAAGCAARSARTPTCSWLRRGRGARRGGPRGASSSGCQARGCDILNLVDAYSIHVLPPVVRRT